MKCVVCKHKELSEGLVTVTLQRGEKIIVVKKVPASICENCGDYILSETVTQRLVLMAEHAIKDHDVEIEVLNYAA